MPEQQEDTVIVTGAARRHRHRCRSSRSIGIQGLCMGGLDQQGIPMMQGVLSRHVRLLLHKGGVNLKSESAIVIEA